MVAKLRAPNALRPDSVGRNAASHQPLTLAAVAALSRASEPTEDNRAGTTDPTGDSRPQSDGPTQGADANTKGLLRQAAGSSGEQRAGYGDSGGIAAGKLTGALKSQLESKFGVDFSAVTVHPNSAEADQRGVHGFARGNEIHLGAARSAGPEGWRTLVHEAAHVVQQRTGHAGPWTKSSYQAAETDAEQAAESGLAGGSARVGLGAPAGIVQGDPIGSRAPLVDDEVPPTDTTPPAAAPTAAPAPAPTPAPQPSSATDTPSGQVARQANAPAPNAAPDLATNDDALPNDAPAAPGDSPPASDPATAPDASAAPAPTGATPDGAAPKAGDPASATGRGNQGGKDKDAGDALRAGVPADADAAPDDAPAAGAAAQLRDLEAAGSLADEKMNTFIDTNASQERGERISQAGTATQVLGQQTDGFHGKIQKPEASSWTDNIFPSGKDLTAAKAKWDANPFKDSTDGLGKVLSGLHQVGVVIGTLNGILSKVSLIATGLGLILTILVPPVGAFLLSAARIANIITVILSGIQLLIGTVKAGLTAVRIAKEKDPLKRQMMAQSMREDLSTAVGAGIDVILSKLGGKNKAAKAGPKSAYSKALNRAQAQGAKDLAGKTGVRAAAGQAKLAVTSRMRAVSSATKQGFFSAKNTMRTSWEGVSRVFQKQTWVSLGRTTMHQAGRFKNVARQGAGNAWKATAQAARTHLGSREAIKATLRAAPGAALQAGRATVNAAGRGLRAGGRGIKRGAQGLADAASGGKFTKEGLTPGRKALKDASESQFMAGWRSVMGPALKDMPWYKVPASAAKAFLPATKAAFVAGWQSFKKHKFFDLYSAARESGSGRTSAYLHAMFHTNVDWSALKNAYTKGAASGPEAGWFRQNVGSRFTGFKAALEEFRTNSPLTHAIHQSMKGETATPDKPATPLWGATPPVPGAAPPMDPLLAKLSSTAVAGASTIQGIAGSESTAGGLYHLATGGTRVAGAVKGQTVAFDSTAWRDGGELKLPAQGVLPAQWDKTKNAANGKRSGSYVDGLSLMSTSGYKASAQGERDQRNKTSVNAILANVASASPAPAAPSSSQVSTLLSGMNQRIAARLGADVSGAGADPAGGPMPIPMPEPPTESPSSPAQITEIAEQRAQLKAMLPRVKADMKDAEENKRQALVAWTQATVGKQKAEEMREFFTRHKAASDKDVADFVTGKAEIAKISSETTSKNADLQGGVQQSQAKQNEGGAVTIKPDEGAKKKEEEKKAQEQYNSWKREYDSAGRAKKAWMKAKKWASSMWDFMKKAADWVFKQILKPIIDKAKSLVGKFMNYLTSIVMKMMLQAAGLDSQEANNLAFGQQVDEKDQQNQQAGQDLACGSQLSVEVSADASKAEKEAGDEVNRQTANIQEGAQLEQQITAHEQGLAGEEEAAKSELGGFKGQYRPYFVAEAERELAAQAGGPADPANAVDPATNNGLPAEPKVEAADAADLVAAANQVQGESQQAETTIGKMAAAAQTEVERAIAKDLEHDERVARDWAIGEAKRMRAQDPDQAVDEGALSKDRLADLKAEAADRGRVAQENLANVKSNHASGESQRRTGLETEKGAARALVGKKFDSAIAAAIERMQQHLVDDAAGVHQDSQGASQGIGDAVKAAWA